MPGDENIIIVERVAKVYHGATARALDGVSIEIGRGELFGLLGPNGAGKTTLISILCGMFAPTEGRATICGFDLERQRKEIRRVIGVVPQEVALYDRLTARENLTFFARMHELVGRRLRQRVDECLELTGLEESADRLLGQYSGGMKRRANLAVGLLHEPQVLFLDEPTVGIDAQSRGMILDRLEAINRQGMTMVYTTHYMEEAERLCRRVAIIDAGRVLAQGAPEEILKNNKECANLDEIFLHLTGKELRD